MTLQNSHGPDQVLDDLEEEETGTAEQVAAVMAEARNQRRLQVQLANLKAETEKVEQDLNKSKTDTLPKLMEAAKLGEEFPLAAGYMIEKWTEVRANIPSPDNKKVENAAEAHRVGIEYADEVCPDLVQNIVTITFKKGEEAWYKKFLRDCAQRKNKLKIDFKRTVHASTLSKWVRGQDALGKKVDEDKLRVSRKTIAEVKAPESKDAIE